MPERSIIPIGPLVGRRRAEVPEARVQARPRLWLDRWLRLGLGASTAALLLSVAAHRVPYFPTDLLITRAVQGADLHLLAPPLAAVNTLGFPPLVGIVYGLIIVALFVRVGRWEAVSAGFATLGGAAINAIVKSLVDRARPDAALVHVERHIANPSYPAGHVLNFTVFVGFLCCLLYLRLSPSWRRTTAIALLLALIALMGVARIRSGEHWPSDVLGGYLLGTAWLAVTLLFYEWGRRKLAHVGSIRNAFFPFRAFLVLLIVLASAVLVRPALAQAPARDSLSATTAVPWNPPQALPRRQGWEQAVLLPGRIVSLPFATLGMATENLLFRMEQNPRLSLGLKRPPGTTGNFVIGTARLGDRTGLGGAVAVHEDVLHGAFQSRIALEYAATLLRYNRTLVTWSGRPLSLQYGNEWRPQDRFYGIGNRTALSAASDYAIHDEFARAGLTWASNRELDPTHPRSVLGVWGGPRSRVTRSGRESRTVSYETLYPALGAATLDRTVENLVYGASLQRDGRSGAPHWGRGWRTLLSAERFDVPVRALALHSGHGDGAQFTRFRAELEGGHSFMRDPRTVRFLVRITDQQVGSNRDRLLPSDYSTLGGRAGLGGYSPGRFHDLDLLLTRLDYVLPLERELELDLHSEWGAVYPDLWSDAKLNTLHHSYGFSLRARSARALRGSVGLDFSREAMRLRFTFGGAE
jgi:membrane-associated phospholipid phosphatase